MEQNRRRQKKTTDWKKIVLSVLCVILALILLGLIVATAYVESLMNKINRPGDSGETLSSSEIEEILNETQEGTIDPTAETMNAADVTWGTEPQEILGGDNIINILLIGQDRRGSTGRARSDAMILCTLNKEKKTLTMTSFMRDMYVQIPGRDPNRINSAYAIGGMKLLNQTLYNNFGVQVDGNVEVDFNGFIKVLDLMGGVDIELTQAEAEYMNKNVSWDVVEGEVWDLKEGMNHLTGAQALSYARIRYVGNADFGRTARQRKVLAALVEKAKSLNLVELNRLLNEVVGLITTDMTNAEIASYMLEVFPLLTDLELKTQQIPASGAYKSAVINGMAVLVPDLTKNRKILLEALGK